MSLLSFWNSVKQTTECRECYSDEKSRCIFR